MYLVAVRDTLCAYARQHDCQMITPNPVLKSEVFKMDANWQGEATNSASESSVRERRSREPATPRARPQMDM